MPGGVSQYVLQGGPCDGNTGELSPDIDASAQIECKGGIYKRDTPAKVIGGREVFSFAGKAPQTDKPFKAARAHGGWADLRQSVNRHMPHALRASQRSTQAALRSLNRARRVRL